MLIKPLSPSNLEETFEEWKFNYQIKSLIVMALIVLFTSLFWHLQGYRQGIETKRNEVIMVLEEKGILTSKVKATAYGVGTKRYYEYYYNTGNGTLKEQKVDW